MTVADYYNSHQSRCRPSEAIPLVHTKSAKRANSKPFKNLLPKTRGFIRSNAYDRRNNAGCMSATPANEQHAKQARQKSRALAFEAIPTILG
jgi:hypothetical protein